MRWAGVLVAAATVALAADEAPSWDWLPAAVWHGEGFDVALRAPGAWTAEAPGGTVASERRGEVVQVHVEGTPAAVTLRAGARTITLRLVAPGAGAGLTAAAGRLRLDDAVALLAPVRREREEDRRWSAWRRAGPLPPLRCEVVLTAPAGPWGEPALPALIVAAQGASVRGAGVLVALPDADRLAGWNRRLYRQCLAWLVADLAARGATPVLVAPSAPMVEAGSADGLLAEVRAVAAAWQVRVVEPQLADARLWADADGQQQAVMNDAGRAAWRAAVAAYLP
jgi:hypothetical protein